MEILVAVLLFALVWAAAVRTFVAAEGARRASARWMTATALARAAIEQLRAGGPAPAPALVAGPFTRTWDRELVDRATGLERLRVRVAWPGGSYTLVTWARRGTQ